MWASSCSCIGEVGIIRRRTATRLKVRARFNILRSSEFSQKDMKSSGTAPAIQFRVLQTDACPSSGTRVRMKVCCQYMKDALKEKDTKSQNVFLQLDRF
jgi:hypothetical protein